MRSGFHVDAGRRVARAVTGPHDPTRPYGRRLVLTYVFLVVATVVGIAVVEVWSSSDVVERYGPNLVAELVGILVTLAVVERLLTWQRERAATPLRMVATRRFWRLLSSL